MSIWVCATKKSSKPVTRYSWRKRKPKKKRNDYDEENALPTQPAGDVTHSIAIDQEKALFAAIVLSAGESFDYLPIGFQEFFEAHGISKDMDFEMEFFDKSPRRQKLKSVWSLLNEIGLNVSREEKFKNYLMTEVIIPLTSV